jgi:hypothetical protein
LAGSGWQVPLTGSHNSHGPQSALVEHSEEVADDGGLHSGGHIEVSEQSSLQSPSPGVPHSPMVPKPDDTQVPQAQM